MSCASCPSPTPVVSLGLSRRVVESVPEEHRLRLFIKALEWLVTRHEGLTVYLGVNGRPYTQEERVAIAKETQAVRVLPCPFMEGETCLLDRLPLYEFGDEVQKPPYLFLPTAVAKLIDEETLREVVRRKEVADAKVALLSRNEAFHA